MRLRILGVTAFIILSCGFAAAQTTAFNFQGKLNDGGNAANGSYDFQFRLFDAIVGGNQVGATLDRPSITVNSGVFSTTLDFGANAFGGNARFLEIGVRTAGSSNAHVVLGARQQILAVPYAVSSSTASVAQNANTLGGLSPSQYARLGQLNIGDFALSGNYVQQGNLSTTDLTVSQNANVNNAAVGVNASVNGTATVTTANVGTANIGTANITGNSSVGGNSSVTGNLAFGGNVTQPAAANGSVKALAFVVGVQKNPAIVRCYNGVTGNSGAGCGFTLTEPIGRVGVYRIDFGFPVDSRFILVTPRYQGSSSGSNSVLSFREVNSTSVEFFSTKIDSPADTRITDFMVMVY